ncbi:MAG: hypothetical protein ABEJ56_06785 [Candidatus Nanohaloarchaea archaeon]
MTIIAVNEPIQDTVRYNTGDYNVIAETKLKADQYERRMGPELNYSANIMAFRLGEKAGDYKRGYDISWKNSPPEPGKLKQEYFSGVENHLRGQMQVMSCRSPRIGSTGVKFEQKEDVTSWVKERHFTSKISDQSLRCSSGYTETYVPVKKKYSVENDANRYVKMAKHTSNLVGKIFSSWKSKAGSEYTGSGSDCGSRSAAVSEAESDATSSAKRDLYSSMTSAIKSYSKLPEGIEVSKKGVKSVSNLGSPDVDSEPDSCDCETRTLPDGSTETYGCETDYDADVKLTLESAKGIIELRDEKKQVLTNKGRKHLGFLVDPFSYEFE